MNNNTVASITKENDNENKTHLLIEQFKDFNIEIYGTFDKPLFKAKDIGDLLGIKNVKDTIKNYNNKQKSGVVLTDPTEDHKKPICYLNKDCIKC